MPDIHVLISHAHDETKFATAWKDLLQGISAGVIKVWYSSDTRPSEGIVAGEEWRSKLYQMLQQSDFVIAIQTPTSSGRAWVMWECGVASGVRKERGIIPIVYGMGRGDLASPLATYQVYQGENDSQVRQICQELANAAGLQIMPQFLDILIPKYMETVAAQKINRIPTVDTVALAKRRIETMLATGRSSEIVDARRLMYISLGGPQAIAADLHDLLSRVLLDQKRIPECLEEVEFALKMVGEDVELLHRKALAQVEAHNLPAAKEIVTKLYALNSNLRTDPEIASLEGRIHRTVWLQSRSPADLEPALNAYLRSYEQDKERYYPGINAAELALFKGDEALGTRILSEVKETCVRLQQVPIVSYWTDFTLGNVYLGLGDIEAAMAEYRRGMNRTPAPGQRDRESAAAGARRMAEAKELPADVVAPVLSCFR